MMKKKYMEIKREQMVGVNLQLIYMVELRSINLIN